jgi:hypothetical protein
VRIERTHGSAALRQGQIDGGATGRSKYRGLDRTGRGSPDHPPQTEPSRPGPSLDLGRDTCKTSATSLTTTCPQFPGTLYDTICLRHHLHVSTVARHGLSWAVSRCGCASQSPCRWRPELSWAGSRVLGHPVPRAGFRSERQRVPLVGAEETPVRAARIQAWARPGLRLLTRLPLVVDRALCGADDPGESAPPPVLEIRVSGR